MGAVRKALFWAAVSLAVTMVPLVGLCAWQGLNVPLLNWFVAIVTSGGVSFLVVLRLTTQSERLRHINKELREAQVLLKYAAESDQLTAVLNRFAFLEHAEAHHAHAEGWMLLLDIDHFKAINDRFGHEVGDRALQHVASVLRGSLRADDIIGRLGGEEFGIYLPGASSEKAMQIAERVRRNIEKAAEFAAQGILLTVSIGLAEAKRAVAVRDCLRQADFAMYGAKQEGRNRISLTAATLEPEIIATVIETPSPRSFCGE
ncbi:GGDEF domain-containing protein [Sphingomonas sp. TX0543]|uniref:GGDEF domain-containing protein n=1 Tax=unclassified Sphingomonas TaxID=196159 RepID=UPI0010F45652|nr:GGDEF domain-containing protein [Sphingomonas sp. 3P27F8]